MPTAASVVYASVAFAIASVMAWLELVTSKYPRTIRLFWRRSWALWAYPVVYGLISFGFTLAFVPLKRANLLNFQGAAGDELTIFTAVVLGLSAKALLHIRFFAVPTTGTQQTFPVGTESLVQLFEPWLLRTIAIDEFNAVARYLDARADLHPDLKAVRQRIGRSLPGPSSFSEAERGALLTDVERATSVRSALESYLRAFGVATLDQHFPPRRP